MSMQRAAERCFAPRAVVRLVLSSVLLFALFMTSFDRSNAAKSPSELKIPKWPFDVEDPYDVPVVMENLPDLHIGVGSAAIGEQIKEWSFAYSKAQNNYDYTQSLIYYQIGINLTTDLAYISRSDRPEAFITVEQYMDDALQKQFPNVTQWPIAYQPYVFAYNVPGFDLFIQDRPTQCIVLTVPLLADIYMGDVTNWNDTRIRELNPTLAHRLPNATIVPFGYGVREPSTLFVTEAFCALSPKFKRIFKEPFYQWPVGHPNLNPNLRLGNSIYSPLAQTWDVPGTLAYVGLPIFNAAGGKFAPYALIKHNGEIRIPDDEESTIGLFEDARMDTRRGNVVVDIDYNSTNAYPISGITYLFVVVGTPNSAYLCAMDRQTFLFLNWIFTDELAQRQALANGIFFMPEKIRKGVFEQWMSLDCYDHPGTLLELEIVDDHDGGEFEALLILSAVLGGIFNAVGLVLTFVSDRKKKPNRKRFSVVGVMYKLLLIAGAVISYASVAFFYLVPKETWVCQMRTWLLATGFTLFLGTMFTRTLQMHRIYRVAQSKTIKVLSGREQTIRGIYDFVWGVGVTFLVQIVVLIVWSTVDPLSADLSVFDEVTREASWVCKCDDIWIWMGIEIGFFVCMIFYGLFVVYRTWSMKNKFDEAKWLLMAVYNMLFALTVLLSISATIRIKDKQVYFIATAGINFVICSSLLLVYTPVFGRHLEGFLMRLRSKVVSRDTDPDATTAAATSNTVSNATRTHENSGSSESSNIPDHSVRSVGV